MDSTRAILYLWYGSIALMGILCTRLFASGLWRSYKGFVFYISALLAESLVLMTCTGHRVVYLRVWTFSRPTVLLTELVAVLGIFGRWTFSFPGMGAFGRRLGVVLLTVSIGLSFLIVPVSWAMSGWSIANQVVAGLNRGANAFFAFFLLLTLGFFHKFGGPVAPNLRKHTWSMAAFVGANTISHLIFSGRKFTLANILLDLVSISALVFWIVALTKAGEVKPTTPMNPEEWAANERMNDQMQKLADSVSLTPYGLKLKRETQVK